MELKDDLYVVSFKTEGVEQIFEKSGKDDGDDGGNEDSDGDSIPEEEKEKEGVLVAQKLTNLQIIRVMAKKSQKILRHWVNRTNQVEVGQWEI